MNFQDRLKSLSPYVTGLRFVKDVPVVDVLIDTDWVFQEPPASILVKESDKTQYYYMFYSDDPNTTIDNILDFVESCVNLNKEIRLKKELLIKRTYELEQLFGNSSYEDLLQLEFIFKNKETKLNAE